MECRQFQLIGTASNDLQFIGGYTNWLGAIPIDWRLYQSIEGCSNRLEAIGGYTNRLKAIPINWRPFQSIVQINWYSHQWPPTDWHCLKTSLFCLKTNNYFAIIFVKFFETQNTASFEIFECYENIVSLSDFKNCEINVPTRILIKNLITIMEPRVLSSSSMC